MKLAGDLGVVVCLQEVFIPCLNLFDNPVQIRDLVRYVWFVLSEATVRSCVPEVFRRRHLPNGSGTKLPVVM